MLTELYSHIHQDPPPADVNTTVETHKFLKACNMLFEEGFLSHEKVSSMEFNCLTEYFTWLPVLHIMALNTAVGRYVYHNYGCFSTLTNVFSR